MRHSFRRSVFVALSMLPLAAVQLAAQDRGAHAAEAATTASITGMVHLNGCTITAASLRLEAVPLALGNSTAPEPPRAGALRRMLSPASRPARFEASRSPYWFAFTIPRLRQGTLYRLRVGVDGEGCGRVFWRGPAGGLALAGGDPLTIEGFAARTRVEVEDADGNFVAADALQLPGTTNLAASTTTSVPRTFRWTTTLPDVTSGELQVATEAFPTRGAFSPCDEEPEAVVLRQTVAAPARAGEWVQATVDFGGLLARTAGGQANSVPPLSTRARRFVLAGRPLYVRVVPLAGSGEAPVRLCDPERDGVHGWAMLAKLPDGFDVPPPPYQPRPLDAGDDQQYLPPYLGGDGQGHPTYGELAFKVIKDHPLPNAFACAIGGGNLGAGWGWDPLGCTIVHAGWLPAGSTVPKGVWFYFTPASGGGGGGNVLSNLGDSLGSLATGFVTAVGLGVDALSNLAASVKAAVTDVVVSVIQAVPGIGAVCQTYPSECKSLVSTGLEVGLASMGMPPPLPNWEQLKDQGIDYLAAEVASEVASTTGLPPELVQQFTEQQVHELAEQAIAQMDAARGGTNPAFDWVIPYLGFEPASWTLTAVKTTTGGLSSQLYLRRPDSFLYAGGNLPVPTTFPASGSLRIPMALQPNLAGIPPPLCLTDKFYHVSCTPTFGNAPRCRSEQWMGPSAPSVWNDYPCEWTNFTSIYYRDRWVLGKLDLVSCTGLGAKTQAEVNGLFLDSPLPPFQESWLVQPMVPVLGVSGTTYSGCLP